MKLEKIPLAETRSFNSFFLDYLEKKEDLKPFYNRYPEVNSFKAQIDDKKKSFSQVNRDVLVGTLLEQYKNIQLSESVKSNIVALSDSNTFTITTGHQLNVFTGPLYFHYKIVTVINACKELKS